MTILSNCHTHTQFCDGRSTAEEMVLSAIENKFVSLGFSTHGPQMYDPDYCVIPEEEQAYKDEILRLQEKYQDKIKILFGIELGLQPHLTRKIAPFAKNYDFDFIIGSTHVCNGMDPYWPHYYFKDKTEEQAYGEYFQSIIDNTKKFSNFDVYGHLDYVVRYGPNRDLEYSYAKYQEYFDPMLKLLIENGKGIEVNTGGVKRGMRELHPITDVIKRYHELGGEIITIGSDSHEDIHIADAFPRAAELLKECGFKYYTVFEKRTPEFFRL
jgi:histidinol-phosphatase (PHP family)